MFLLQKDFFWQSNPHWFRSGWRSLISLEKLGQATWPPSFGAWRQTFLEELATTTEMMDGHVQLIGPTGQLRDQWAQLVSTCLGVKVAVDISLGSNVKHWRQVLLGYQIGKPSPRCSIWTPGICSIGDCGKSPIGSGHGRPIGASPQAQSDILFGERAHFRGHRQPTHCQSYWEHGSGGARSKLKWPSVPECSWHPFGPYMYFEGQWKKILYLYLYIQGRAQPVINGGITPISRTLNYKLI